jgi:hypothetical protein
LGSRSESRESRELADGLEPRVKDIYNFNTGNSFLNPKTKHMSMLTVRRSDVDHQYLSSIENVQELIKEMNTDPNGLIVQVSNAEGTLETFHSPAVRGSKVSVRSELLRLQTLVD